MPRIFLIGGPNGAGKTTCAMTLLPDILNCREYVNADSIAAGLSPFKPESIALTAGRMMVERVHALAQQGQDFAFETTMASRSFAPFLIFCRKNGYSVSLLYLWLRSPALAVKRVALRVSGGGHSIPRTIIHRRYHSGLRNFVNLYLPICDQWWVYDNSADKPELVAYREIGRDETIKLAAASKQLMEMAS